MSTTAKKARRLAGRTVRVVKRHTDHPALRTYETSLTAKSDAFRTAYDTAAKYGPRYTREFAEGRSALAQLVQSIKTWAPVVAGAIQGFEESEYGDNPDVADDTLNDANGLLELIDETEGLSFAADLKADLEPRLAAATKECAEAEAADVEYQSLLKAQRETLALFLEELSRYRRTLRSALGSTHKDFQKLRAEKSSTPDEDDDPEQPTPTPTA